MFKKLLQTILVKPSDLITLFSYSDKINTAEITAFILGCFRSLKIGILLYIIISVLLVYALTIAPFVLSDTNAYLSLIICLLILLIVRILHSSYINRYINYPFSRLVIDKLNSFRKEYERYFDKKNTTDFNELYSNLGGYGFSLYNICGEFLDILVVIISVLVISAPIIDKTLILSFATLITIAIGMAGYFYSKSALLIREKMVNHEEPDAMNLRIRVWTPGVSNLILNFIIPVIVLFLTIYQNNRLIPQMVILSSIAAFSWGIVENIQKFIVANRSLQLLNKHFRDLENNYVVNQKSFERMSELCKPNEETMKKSKKSLVLKDFHLKYTRKDKYKDRRLNFTFESGIYQLHGTNGMGKSTFLESISLSKESKVEFCSGEAALDQFPLYDSTLRLKEHWNKVRYIGKNTEIADLKELKLEDYKKYPFLYAHFVELLKEEKEKYSDGEKAITLIAKGLQEISEIESTTVLILDEMISRIYEDNALALRSEIINLIKDFAKKHSVIVIIVDHVIRIEEARHVYLDMEGVSLRL
jgi:ABC-type cobalamin/Fe3+-siderophores transport system ATPase subunit